MKKKILVIDDEAQTLEMLQMLLEMYGFEVLLAQDGQDALRIYEQEKPEIILTDIKMPIMDGMEVLGKIKKSNPAAEVIVITGHGDMELASKALNLDATDFINKPVQRNVLDQALKRAEERIRMARNNQETLRITIDDTGARITVLGCITATSEAFLKDVFAKALESGRKRILLVFEQNASINGAGIALLSQHLVACRDKGVTVHLVGFNDNFHRVIETVGISNLVTVHETLDDAIQAE